MAYDMKKGLELSGDWLSINVQAANTITGLGIAVTIQGGVMVEVFSPLLIESNLGVLVNVDISWVVKWHTSLTQKSFGAMKVRNADFARFKRSFGTRLTHARRQRTRQAAVLARLDSAATSQSIDQLERRVQFQQARVTTAEAAAVVAMGARLQGRLTEAQADAQRVVGQATNVIGVLDSQALAMNEVAATVTENFATLDNAYATKIATTSMFFSS